MTPIYYQTQGGGAVDKYQSDRHLISSQCESRVLPLLVITNMRTMQRSLCVQRYEMMTISHNNLAINIPGKSLCPKSCDHTPSESKDDLQDITMISQGGSKFVEIILDEKVFYYQAVVTMAFAKSLYVKRWRMRYCY